jgi:hypothetical protein
VFDISNRSSVVLQCIFHECTILTTSGFEEIARHLSDRYFKMHVTLIRFLVFYLSSGVVG